MAYKRKPRVKLPKIYNSKTMTVVEFWTMIRSALRKCSRWWKPIQTVKMKHRRKYNGPNKRLKFEYQCNICKNWFPDKHINVDHIIPVGSLMSGDDLKAFVENLFCEEENLQIACSGCHNKKTQKEKAIRKANKLKL